MRVNSDLQLSVEQNSEQLNAILDDLVKEYTDALSEKGIAFSYDDEARRYLAKKAYGGPSGARDLRNLIRKEVEDKIANAIVESHTGLISSIKVTTEGEPAEAVKLEITE